MDTNRWQQIDELFDAVLNLPETEREAFLAAHTNGDEDLKNEVLSLLDAEKESNNFLNQSALKVAAKKLAADQSAPLATTLSGQTLGTYKIEKSLGAGGMGEVYLARDEKLRRQVALKILPAEYTFDDERIRRFQQEARAISALNHPNIVTIYDVGARAEINYIATEYVEGQTLRELIASKPKLKDTLNIIIQCCEALAAAHSHGIIHRDIKPENIMVRPDGYVKILDFGLAKLSATETPTTNSLAQTAQGLIIGTPSYMSPVQVAGERVDQRADLWGLGVVLYELLTGVNPFKKENRQATFQAILSEEPPRASSLKAEITDELDQILSKALEKDADLGYQTASDLRADVKRVKRELDSSPSLRSGSLSRQRQEAARTRRYFLPAFFLLLLLLGLGIWYAGFFPRQPRPVDWSQATNLQLTDQAGTEMFPTLAPDGKSFVFAAVSARGDYDLFWQRVGDKRARNITEDSAADDTQPAFSPDGERIAFRSAHDGASGVYVASATGENVRRVADFGYHPAWSPDGKEIVVSTMGRDLPDVRNNPRSALWIVNLASGAKRLLTDEDTMQPAWSPDGKFVAYWFYPPSIGRRDIGVIPVTGGASLVITKDGTTNWNPVWSPDGKYLYFASDRGGNMGFWRVGFDDGKIVGEPEAVVTPSKYSRHLAFSRDGKRMIYVSTDNKANIQAVGFEPQSEKIVGTPFWITRGDREISRPDLSPDGTRFVYRLSRRTQDDIVVINRDGTNQRDLTNDAAFDRYPRWSPDGKRIAFASDRSGVYEIWIIDADGTNLRQITFTGKDGTSFPLWSPDGQRLLYRGAPHNYVIDLNKSWTEQTPQMLPDYSAASPRLFVAWNWSPDGARLAGSLNGLPTEAVIYSFAASRYENITDLDRYPMFLPDSRRIIYGLENRLFIADTATKKTHEITGLSPAEDIRTVGISRDGRLIYYTLISSESDIWLLDNTQNP